MPSILDRFRLDGKVAWITGASSGLGLEIAKAYSEAGAKIVFNDVNKELVKKDTLLQSVLFSGSSSSR